MQARQFQVFCFRKPTLGSEPITFLFGVPLSVKGIFYMLLAFVFLYIGFLSPIGSFAIGPLQIGCIAAAFFFAVFAFTPWLFFTPDVALMLFFRYLGKRKVVKK